MLLFKETSNLELNKKSQTIFESFSKIDKQTVVPMKFGWLEDHLSAKLALFPTNSGAIFVDFLEGKKRHRRQCGGGKRQPMARAVGINSNKTPTILDATTGMGNDAFVFASLGCKVQMLERSPVIVSLLKDALDRASKFNDTGIMRIIKNMSLINDDSANFLLKNKPIIDVVYMDPMYPKKKKKTAVKKEMVALQNLIGADLDSSILLAAALQVAKLRVTVKRPAKAPIIALTSGIKPDTCIKSPNTRYDVYFCNSQSF